MQEHGGVSKEPVTFVELQSFVVRTRGTVDGEEDSHRLHSTEGSSLESHRRRRVSFHLRRVAEDTRGKQKLHKILQFSTKALCRSFVCVR